LVIVAGQRSGHRIVTPTRRRHLASVPDGADPTDGVNVDLVAAAAAHRLYERVLGPVGTDPDQTGDLLLVPLFRRPNGTLANRDRLERELTAVLVAAMGDDLEGAAARLGEHLADVLLGLGVPPAVAQ
jgi:hypothetical protein